MVEQKILPKKAGTATGMPFSHATQSADSLLVSQTEAARLLGVERTTVWRLASRGELTLVKVAGRALISRESIHALITRASAK